MLCSQLFSTRSSWTSQMQDLHLLQYNTVWPMRGSGCGGCTGRYHFTVLSCILTSYFFILSSYNNIWEYDLYWEVWLSVLSFHICWPWGWNYPDYFTFRFLVITVFSLNYLIIVFRCLICFMLTIILFYSDSPVQYCYQIAKETVTSISVW